MFNFFKKEKKELLLQSSIDKIVNILSNNTLTTNEVIYEILKNCNKETLQEDLYSASKIIIKKYGKKNVIFFKFPVDNYCPYAKTAHNECACLSKYCRPLK